MDIDIIKLEDTLRDLPSPEFDRKLFTKRNYHISDFVDFEEVRNDIDDLKRETVLSR